MYRNENIHILSYYKNNKPNNEIINYLKILEEKRVERAKKILEKLDILCNIKLDFLELKKISNGSVGRPHIAELIMKKYGLSRDIIFNKLIGDNCSCYIPSSNQDLKETIDFLHKNDALVILAHPIYYKKTSIEEFIELGIDGIESFYPEHKKKFRKKLVKIANKYNLIITGGSDFHDDKKYIGKKNINIGYSYIEDEYISVLLERLGKI